MRLWFDDDTLCRIDSQGSDERHVDHARQHTVYLSVMSPIVLRVRELREAKGWSQRDLARRAKVRQATVSAIEAGQTKGIDFVTLERLAKALAVDPGYLIVKKGR